MMLAIVLVALFAVTAIATGLSLLDSWIRGRSALDVLRREHALLEAGFVPMVEAGEVRLRETVTHRSATRAPARRTLAAVSRGHARRVPLPDCA